MTRPPMGTRNFDCDFVPVYFYTIDQLLHNTEKFHRWVKCEKFCLSMQNYIHIAYFLEWPLWFILTKQDVEWVLHCNWLIKELVHNYDTSAYRPSSIMAHCTWWRLKYMLKCHNYVLIQSIIYNEQLSDIIRAGMWSDFIPLIGHQLWLHQTILVIGSSFP